MTKNLAAMLGSRICHDLIGPLGAINNGVELLELSGMGADTPEMALMRDSVQNATARLTMFRVAFGLGNDRQQIVLREILTTLDVLQKGGRMKYVWHAQGNPMRRHVRMIYLALLCIESTMPRGATVTVTQEEDGWHVDAAGKPSDKVDGLWQALAAQEFTAETAPSEVHFPLLHLAADGPVPAERTDTGLRLRLPA